MIINHKYLSVHKILLNFETCQKILGWSTMHNNDNNKEAEELEDDFLLQVTSGELGLLASRTQTI